MLAHLLKLLILSTLGVAFTSKVNENGDPLHPKNEGVTINSLVTGILEKLLAM